MKVIFWKLDANAADLSEMVIEQECTGCRETTQGVSLYRTVDVPDIDYELIERPRSWWRRLLGEAPRLEKRPLTGAVGTRKETRHFMTVRWQAFHWYEVQEVDE